MPKKSIKKLWSLAAQKLESKDKRRDLLEKAHMEELQRASQDLQDMKDCYDSLQSAAASAANSAFEFSLSLSDLGTCLVEKNSSIGDEESGELLLMLGKAQFELQKLVDQYRSHISQTISTPSESFLNELQTVQAMKQQCDEKRVSYEARKARAKTSKDSLSPKKLREAQEEYEHEVSVFIFRVKSLKQGQSRSFLTQAVRHHSAQLSFLQKGVRVLQRVEPRVKTTAEKQHIDHRFKGLDEPEPVSDGSDGSTGNLRSWSNSMEDAVGSTNVVQEFYRDRPRKASLSAPISTEKRPQAYALPLPTSLAPDDGVLLNSERPARKPHLSLPTPTGLPRQAFSGPLLNRGGPAMPLPLPCVSKELPRLQPAAKISAPLPRPPPTMARSFSIPSSWQRTSMLTFSADIEKLNVPGPPPLVKQV